MLTLGSLTTLPGRPGLLVFADDSDPGLRHLLSVALVAEGPGALTVMGRGPRDRPEGVLGGFWALSLRGALSEADRTAIASALAAAEGAVPRLVMADARLVLDASLGPEAAAHAEVAGWRGGTVALNGELPAGEPGLALARAWERGLPDARADLALTLTGMGEPAEIVLDERSLGLTAGPGGMRMASSDSSTRSRRQSAATLTIRRRQHLRLPGRAPVVWAGFDREP